MKNPLLVASRWYQTWRTYDRYPGVFKLSDAWKDLRLILQPQRVTNREMRRIVQRELRIRALTDKVHEVEVKRNGLVFYWVGEPAEALGSGLLQELDPTNAHYYNSPPVTLTCSSVVMDIGTCEGLFALRITKDPQVSRVICFEPAYRTAELLRRAAQRNGVSNKIQIETCAVGLDSRDVFFSDLPSADANHVVANNGSGTKIRQVSLDDYCREHGIKLKPIDLIKVDAEGADVGVIKGAERCIREGSPQIAVTTYHDAGHAIELIDFLRSVEPRYRLRLKGVSLWNSLIPRPVLLQAALPHSQRT